MKLEELEASVQDKLDAMFGDLPDDADSVEVVDDDGETFDVELDVETADEQEVEVDTVSDDTAVDDEVAATGAALSPAMRDSLRHYGWEDADIDRNLEFLGDKFVDTATRLHENRIKEIDTWANTGRNVAASAPQPNAVAPLTPLDAAALKEKYGEDALIDEIVGPINAMVTGMNAMLPSLENGTQAARHAEVDALSKQVDQFFDDPGMSKFHSLYGTSKGVTEQQIAARNELIEKAYHLTAGAQALHGRRLPLSEALSHAHEIVSRDYRKESLRDVAVVEAKKRNRAIIRRPTAKGSGDPVKDERDALEAKVGSALRRTFKQ